MEDEKQQPQPQTTPTPADKPPDGGKTPTRRDADAKLFTQEELNEEIKKRLERAEKQRLEAETKVRKDAEADAARQRGEWEKVAKQQETTIADLQKQVVAMEAVRAEVERVNAALDEQLKVERKGLPEHVIELLDRLPPVDQLAYIAKNRDKFDGHSAPQAKLPRTPDPADRTLTADEQNRRLNESAAYVRKLV